MEIHFTLFKNDKKDNDTKPDYVGPYKDKDGNISKYEIAAWIKEGAKGKYLSGVIKERKPFQSEKLDAMYKKTEEDAKKVDDIPF